MLNLQQIDSFRHDGFVLLRGVVSPEVIGRCQDMIWDELHLRGIHRDDPATWGQPVVRINCPEAGPFVEAGTTPALWDVYDQLLGAGTWQRRQGMGGTIPVRFPSPADPRDAGWHIDGSFEGADGAWWVNVRSKARGLLVVFLLSDVDDCSAPTRILKGSHLDVPPLLTAAGDAGCSFGSIGPLFPASTFSRPEVKATGSAGDVYVCHPFLVHAASWPHRGMRPRIIAQPGVAIHEPFRLSPDADVQNVCPVEAAILDGLRQWKQRDNPKA